MIIVSGCPRSGTSNTMNILGTMYGYTRLEAEQFPNEKGLRRFERTPIDTDELWDFKQYQWKKNGIKEKFLKEFENIKKMNPLGFWENEWTVGGIQYSLRNEEKYDETKFCKIVSQGLHKSDPKYVSKVIYMSRHPRAVAKSQEELKGSIPDITQLQIDGEAYKKHSPQMYVVVTMAVAKWFLKNPDIPVLIVDFDDMIENPAEQIKRIENFVGESGDVESAIKTVNPKLRRSYPQDIENELWECAEEIFKYASKGDWQGVLSVNIPKTEEETVSKFFCHRLNREVIDTECQLCRTHEQTKLNYIRTATKRKIKWEDEPCTYDIKFENKSVDESIKESHWKSKGLGDTVAKVLNSVGVKPCSGCQKRKELLNNVFPYKK